MSGAEKFHRNLPAPKNLPGCWTRLPGRCQQPFIHLPFYSLPTIHHYNYYHSKTLGNINPDFTRFELPKVGPNGCVQPSERVSA